MHRFSSVRGYLIYSKHSVPFSQFRTIISFIVGNRFSECRRTVMHFNFLYYEYEVWHRVC